MAGGACYLLCPWRGVVLKRVEYCCKSFGRIFLLAQKYGRALGPGLASV